MSGTTENILTITQLVQRLDTLIDSWPEDCDTWEAVSYKEQEQKLLAELRSRGWRAPWERSWRV